MTTMRRPILGAVAIRGIDFAISNIDVEDMVANYDSSVQREHKAAVEFIAAYREWKIKQHERNA